MQTKEYFIHLTKHELPATLNCIRSVPESGESYAPHEKSRTARRIVAHVIGHAQDLIQAIEEGRIDHRNETEFANYDEAAKNFEADTNRLLSMIETLDEKTWDEKPVDFYVFGRKIRTQPLRDICYHLHSDTLHHRGQLSTYYRNMGVRNPVIYGATAETVEEMMAASKN